MKERRGLMAENKKRRWAKESGRTEERDWVCTGPGRIIVMETLQTCPDCGYGRKRGHARSCQIPKDQRQW
jgi:hypothetical protein